jgi:hypothetical protein
MKGLLISYRLDKNLFASERQSKPNIASQMPLGSIAKPAHAFVLIGWAKIPGRAWPYQRARQNVNKLHIKKAGTMPGLNHQL